MAIEGGSGGAQLERTQFLHVRIGSAAVDYIYHEESFMLDPILKSRTQQLIKNDRCCKLFVSDLFCNKITIRNRSPQLSPRFIDLESQVKLALAIGYWLFL